jgi:hypothetical protein
MVNQSKVNDPRFWKKWKESGAVGNLEDATNTAVYGSETAKKLRKYDCRNEDLAGIDKALQAGYTLRVFRSGGGLRVVRIEEASENRDGELRGYGEHPNLMPALIRASKDFLAGGQPYECVYLTGTTQAEDSLDTWVLRGHKLWAEKNEHGIRVEARDFNYKPVLSVVEDTFEKAYATLCGQVNEEAFQKANGF